MEYIGDVFYSFGDSLYVNMTNRCPCRCAFCIRNLVDSLGDADSLWLKREPTEEEVFEMLRDQSLINTVSLSSAAMVSLPKGLTCFSKYAMKFMPSQTL